MKCYGVTKSWCTKEEEANNIYKIFDAKKLQNKWPEVRTIGVAIAEKTKKVFRENVQKFQDFKAQKWISFCWTTDLFVFVVFTEKYGSRMSVFQVPESDFVAIKIHQKKFREINVSVKIQKASVGL